VPRGQWLDHKLVRYAFFDGLQPGEKAMGDASYHADRYFENEMCLNETKRILARHETVNRRIKYFYCITNKFRPALHLHPTCFNAYFNLTPLKTGKWKTLVIC